jgi:hypothetical protein
MPRPFTDEIRLLRAAIARSEAEIQRMHDEVTPCPCCPACGAIARFGDRYLHLTRKHERQASWLLVLIRKSDGTSEERRRAEKHFTRVSRIL